jgi:formate hydrogenlyase subunit 3/multisubunit Na+/H+ antiporter MnhD subunit
MGICGAFLTGDVFNLFVFFEVLLIASYGLMIHAGGRERMRAGLQYVVMNLAGSTLFLFALGTLYASTGTLNIADLAVKAAEIPPEEAALVRVAAMLLMIVFAVKAALFPVQFWLPATYANAPAPVAALFAIMTKVGAYAILRVHTTAFGPGIAGTEDLAGTWLFPGAIVTIAVGAFGVLGARRLMPLDRLLGGGLDGHAAGRGRGLLARGPDGRALLRVHSTFAAACLFLVADLVMTRRSRDRLSHRARDGAERPVRGAVLRGRHRHGGDAAAERASSASSSCSTRCARRLADGLGLDGDPRGLASDHRRLRAGREHAVLEVHRRPARSPHCEHVPPKAPARRPCDRGGARHG